MKKNVKILALLFASTLLTSFLSGCEEGDLGLPNNHYHYRQWGDNKGNPFANDDYGGGGKNNSSRSGNNNSSNSNQSSSNNGGNSGNNELTFDENSTNFGHSFSGTGAGEVAIQVFSDKCKDDDLIIPSTYVDAKGNKYQVTMDYGNGFSYLSAQKITLPDGFKEIHEGFDQSMYVKTIYLPKTITKLYNEILVSCVSLSKIDFAGTKAEWNAITKEERWNAGALAFDVSCKDGIINIEKGPSV